MLDDSKLYPYRNSPSRKTTHPHYVSELIESASYTDRETGELSMEEVKTERSRLQIDFPYTVIRLHDYDGIDQGDEGACSFVSFLNMLKITGNQSILKKHVFTNWEKEWEKFDIENTADIGTVLDIMIEYKCFKLKPRALSEVVSYVPIRSEGNREQQFNDKFWTTEIKYILQKFDITENDYDVCPWIYQNAFLIEFLLSKNVPVQINALEHSRTCIGYNDTSLIFADSWGSQWYETSRNPYNEKYSAGFSTMDKWAIYTWARDLSYVETRHGSKIPTPRSFSNIYNKKIMASRGGSRRMTRIDPDISTTCHISHKNMVTVNNAPLKQIDRGENDSKKRKLKVVEDGVKRVKMDEMDLCDRYNESSLRTNGFLQVNSSDHEELLQHITTLNTFANKQKEDVVSISDLQANKIAYNWKNDKKGEALNAVEPIIRYFHQKYFKDESSLYIAGVQNIYNPEDATLKNQGFHKDIPDMPKCKYLTIAVDCGGEPLRTDIIPGGEGKTWYNYIDDSVDDSVDEWVAHSNSNSSRGPEKRQTRPMQIYTGEFKPDNIKTVEGDILLYDPTLYHRGTEFASKGLNRVFIQLAFGDKGAAKRLIKPNKIKHPWLIRV